MYQFMNEIHFSYFTKEFGECTTLYEKLIYALKNMKDRSRMSDLLKELVCQHLANLSASNRIAYNKAMERFFVNSIVEEDICEPVIQEGIKKGMKKGLEEEIKKGLKSERKRGC